MAEHYGTIPSSEARRNNPLPIIDATFTEGPSGQEARGQEQRRLQEKKKKLAANLKKSPLVIGALAAVFLLSSRDAQHPVNWTESTDSSVITRGHDAQINSTERIFTISDDETASDSTPAQTESPQSSASQTESGQTKTAETETVQTPESTTKVIEIRSIAENIYYTESSNEQAIKSIERDDRGRVIIRIDGLQDTGDGGYAPGQPIQVRLILNQPQQEQEQSIVYDAQLVGDGQYILVIDSHDPGNQLFNSSGEFIGWRVSIGNDREVYASTEGCNEGVDSQIFQTPAEQSTDPATSTSETDNQQAPSTAPSSPSEQSSVDPDPRTGARIDGQPADQSANQSAEQESDQQDRQGVPWWMGAFAVGRNPNHKDKSKDKASQATTAQPAAAPPPPEVTPSLRVNQQLYALPENSVMPINPEQQETVSDYEAFRQNSKYSLVEKLAQGQWMHLPEQARRNLIGLTQFDKGFSAPSDQADNIERYMANYYQRLSQESAKAEAANPPTTINIKERMEAELNRLFRIMQGTAQQAYDSLPDMAKVTGGHSFAELSQQADGDLEQYIFFKHQQISQQTNLEMFIPQGQTIAELTPDQLAVAKQRMQQSINDRTVTAYRHLIQDITHIVPDDNRWRGAPRNYSIVGRRHQLFNLGSKIYNPESNPSSDINPSGGVGNQLYGPEYNGINGQGGVGDGYYLPEMPTDLTEAQQDDVESATQSPNSQQAAEGSGLHGQEATYHAEINDSEKVAVAQGAEAKAMTVESGIGIMGNENTIYAPKNKHDVKERKLKSHEKIRKAEIQSHERVKIAEIQSQERIDIEKLRLDNQRAAERDAELVTRQVAAVSSEEQTNATIESIRFSAEQARQIKEANGVLNDALAEKEAANKAWTQAIEEDDIAAIEEASVKVKEAAKKSLQAKQLIAEIENKAANRTTIIRERIRAGRAEHRAESRQRVANALGRLNNQSESSQSSSEQSEQPASMDVLESSLSRQSETNFQPTQVRLGDAFKVNYRDQELVKGAFKTSGYEGQKFVNKYDKDELTTKEKAGLRNYAYRLARQSLGVTEAKTDPRWQQVLPTLKESVTSILNDWDNLDQNNRQRRLRQIANGAVLRSGLSALSVAEAQSSATYSEQLMQRATQSTDAAELTDTLQELMDRRRQKIVRQNPQANGLAMRQQAATLEGAVLDRAQAIIDNNQLSQPEKQQQIEDVLESSFRLPLQEAADQLTAQVASPDNQPKPRVARPAESEDQPSLSDAEQGLVDKLNTFAGRPAAKQVKALTTSVLDRLTNIMLEQQPNRDRTAVKEALIQAEAGRLATAAEAIATSTVSSSRQDRYRQLQDLVNQIQNQAIEVLESSIPLAEVPHPTETSESETSPSAQASADKAEAYPSTELPREELEMSPILPPVAEDGGNQEDEAIPLGPGQTLLAGTPESESPKVNQDQSAESQSDILARVLDSYLNNPARGDLNQFATAALATVAQRFKRENPDIDSAELKAYLQQEGKPQFIELAQSLRRGANQQAPLSQKEQMVKDLMRKVHGAALTELASKDASPSPTIMESSIPIEAEGESAAEDQLSVASQVNEVEQSNSETESASEAQSQVEGNPVDLEYEASQIASYSSDLSSDDIRDIIDGSYASLDQEQKDWMLEQVLLKQGRAEQPESNQEAKEDSEEHQAAQNLLHRYQSDEVRQDTDYYSRTGRFDADSINNIVTGLIGDAVAAGSAHPQPDPDRLYSLYQKYSRQVQRIFEDAQYNRGYEDLPRLSMLRGRITAEAGE